MHRRMREFFPWLYDAVMVRAEHFALGSWRRGVVACARGLVLEIASGTGLNFPHYRAGTTVIATEVDEAMLQRAHVRARQSRATIIPVLADAQALPFREATFDTAIVGLAMCTIPSPQHALAELHRVLRQRGTLHMLEHVRARSTVIGHLQDWVTPLWRRVAGGCRLNERTVGRVSAAGFRIDDVDTHLGGSIVAIHATNPSRVHSDGPSMLVKPSPEGGESDRRSGFTPSRCSPPLFDLTRCWPFPTSTDTGTNTKEH